MVSMHNKEVGWGMVAIPGLTIISRLLRLPGFLFSIFPAFKGQTTIFAPWVSSATSNKLSPIDRSVFFSEKENFIFSVENKKTELETQKKSINIRIYSDCLCAQNGPE